jgi:signal transduction histidine kinase
MSLNHPDNNSIKTNEFKIVVFILFIVVTVTTIFMVLFYKNEESKTLKAAQVEQLIKIESLSRKLESYSTITSQLSRFVKENINFKDLTKNEIENRLQEFLKSSPDNTIYGIGIWYLPFKFNKSQKYFGPYIHRENGDKFKLTYEWQTPEYNYPNQNWFLAGLHTKTNGEFVEPYFDMDQVYVTFANSFQGSNKEVVGVISIDMILPQLQNIVDSVNSTINEQIFITTKDGKILTHPLKNKILLTDLSKKTLLDFNEAQLKQIFSSQKNEWMTKSIVIPSLNWKININSKITYLLNDVNSLYSTLVVIAIFLWLLLFFIAWILNKYFKEKILFENKIDESHKQLMYSSKMAALGEMAAGVAHEINNPLTIIRGKTERIKRIIESDQPNLKDIEPEIEKIKTTVSRIAKIINSLSTFSRSGEIDPFQLVKLQSIFADTIDLSSDKLKMNNVAFNISTIPDISIECKPSQIVQVLVNLLNNSCDAIIKSEVRWINVDVSIKESRFLEISITDSGLGIDPAIVDKIMLPFFTTKEIGKGTGLGLSISLGIIEAHQGNLYYVKDSSHTKFIIRIPLMQKHL